MAGAGVLGELGRGDPERVGRYPIVGRLSAGGLGQVYLATSAAGREIAVLVMAAALAGNESVRERLASEIRVAAGVTSPYTTKVIDAELGGPELWIATEYVPGPTMELLIASRGPLELPRLLALAAALAEGLRDIHHAGLVHRGLSPSTVIVGADRPRITGLGAAVSEREALASIGTLLGAPEYLSPEQAALDEVAGPSDIFSLGSLLTFAATGAPPFGTGELRALMNRILSGEPDLTDVPSAIRPLVAACLAKDAAERPSAGELLAEVHVVAGRDAGLNPVGLERLLPAIATGSQLAAPGPLTEPPPLGLRAGQPLASAAADDPGDAASPGRAGRGKGSGRGRRPWLRRDRGEGIWPDDGVSDEAYWAEVAADTPLASRYEARLDASLPDAAASRYSAYTSDRADYTGAEGNGYPAGPAYTVSDGYGAGDGYGSGAGRGGGDRYGFSSGNGAGEQMQAATAQGGDGHYGNAHDDGAQSYPEARPYLVTGGRGGVLGITSLATGGYGDYLANRGIAPLSPPPAPAVLMAVGTRPSAAVSAAARPDPWAGGDPAGPRFLTGNLPERAPVGARISLLVWITRTALKGASAGLKEFPVPPDGCTVTITVSAPGLIPFGDLDQDLLVPFASDSKPVRFGFMVGMAGLHKVDVRAFAGGTCLGELTLQMSVQTGATLEEGRPRAAVMTGLAAEPGEVTLQVSRTAGGYSFQLLSEALYPVVLIDRLAGDPAQVAAKIAAELRMMSKGQSPYVNAAHARSRLRSLGTELWADVVPESIRSQFWAQRDRIELFTIASDMDTVPWELMYPVDLHNEDGFLVEQFPVVRRVYGQGRARSLRLHAGAAYVVPPQSPSNALDEVTAVRDALPADVTDRGVQAGLAEVFELLDAIPSVLHFAGHTAFTDEAGSVISLDGGPLRPDDLSYARQKRAFADVSPLVFFNGCRTAGEVAGLTQMNGWAEKFMGAGAGAFIGSLWAVRSSSAKLFAEQFYRALVHDGRPLGVASLQARRAIAADQGDPTWLAYTVYGNPSASLQRNPATA